MLIKSNQSKCCNWLCEHVLAAGQTNKWTPHVVQIKWLSQSDFDWMAKPLHVWDVIFYAVSFC